MTRSPQALVALVLLACTTSQTRAYLVTSIQDGNGIDASTGPDPPFNFTFSDGGVTASGRPNATLSAYGTTYTVTVSGATYYGTFPLIITGPSAPKIFSSSPASILDDRLLLGQDPSLTTGGLLFGVGNGYEGNSWGTGPPDRIPSTSVIPSSAGYPLTLPGSMGGSSR